MAGDSIRMEMAVHQDLENFGYWVVLSQADSHGGEGLQGRGSGLVKSLGKGS